MTSRSFVATCEALDDFGRGIVHLEGKTYFVKDLLPKEEAELETVFSHGKVQEVRLRKRRRESLDRVKPSCPLFPLCGGCQIMHLSYEKQLLYKKEKVQNLLHKFAKIDFPVSPTRGMTEPVRYRNKVQKPIRVVKGKVEIGFYKENSHDLVPALDCPAESRLSVKISRVVLKLIRQFSWPVYDEDRKMGILRHLLIKTNRAESEALVTLIVRDERLPGRKDFARLLMAEVKEVQGVVFNVNPRATNVILGDKDVLILGYPHFRDTIFEKTFLVSTKSFYQTNSKQIETLYGLARDFAAPTKEDKVLDAYCGTGTIGLSLAEQAKEVVGVEIVPDAVKDARQNARINKVENARFLVGDCTEYLGRTKEKFDIIVLDPPRKGATKEFLSSVLSLAPKRIVYVSCAPVTLARDLSYLLSDYKLEEVVPVDMFPNTLHVETVCKLTHR